jgi:ATP-dependent 26S proteasome regulatory subunit
LKARSDGNTMMHRFLNVGDGLVTTKGKKLIFSTNLPSIRDVDPALIRPGRCFDVLSFDQLNGDEAAKLADKLGVTYETKSGGKYSIAEIFNKKVEGTTNNQRVGSKMGFV